MSAPAGPAAFPAGAAGLSAAEDDLGSAPQSLFVPEPHAAFNMIAAELNEPAR
ncbi:hypothetical protein QQY66_47985 [Streptomyces sp. DG2A-72]|uniref:hypothetical protein n=1 Tax=Streptomyces sp. DG2A-72 TaxID=3051386 RepID=UPI00265BFA25|nr:hypothetical protein [Streptomyces sp. DG2A-72]MDO0939078.1 hypothetical protein [Streptomyces sp. DG2A-72]